MLVVMISLQSVLDVSVVGAEEVEPLVSFEESLWCDALVAGAFVTPVERDRTALWALFAGVPDFVRISLLQGMKEWDVKSWCAGGLSDVAWEVGLPS